MLIIIIINYYTMVAERFQKNILDMFYGPLEDENLPDPLEPARIYYWQARKDFGDRRHV